MTAWSDVCVLDDRGGCTLPAEWGQGRAAFGGLVAGLGLRAMRRIVPGRPLRSVLVSFANPAAQGPAQVQARLLREGRALSQVEARLSQGGQDCAVLIAAFGEGRPTAVPRIAGPDAPAAPAPDTLPAFPYLAGITPDFTRFLDYRWVGEGLPFGGGPVARTGGWIRLKDATPVDEAGALAMIDAWPAPVLTLLTAPAAASTVTWMVDFVRAWPPGGVDPEAWWRFEGTTTAAGQGYADVDGLLWGPDGGLVATSRQLVAEFSAPAVTIR